MTEKFDQMWADVSIHDVMQHYVRGFEFGDGSKLHSHEFYYDPTKGRVVFKMLTLKEVADD